jgi:hypothetical protein
VCVTRVRTGEIGRLRCRAVTPASGTAGTSIRPHECWDNRGSASWRKTIMDEERVLLAGATAAARTPRGQALAQKQRALAPRPPPPRLPKGGTSASGGAGVGGGGVGGGGVGGGGGGGGGVREHRLGVAPAQPAPPPAPPPKKRVHFGEMTPKVLGTGGHFVPK